MPSLSPPKKTLAIAGKNHAEPDIKLFWSCLILLDFFLTFLSFLLLFSRTESSPLPGIFELSSSPLEHLILKKWKQGESKQCRFFWKNPLIRRSDKLVSKKYPNFVILSPTEKDGTCSLQKKLSAILHFTEKSKTHLILSNT